MCGIVSYVGERKAVPIILEGLKRLEYRGYDSAGIAVYCDDDTLGVRRASGKLLNLEEVIRQNPVDGRYGIGHTRWATHGRPTNLLARQDLRFGRATTTILNVIIREKETFCCSLHQTNCKEGVVRPSAAGSAWAGF